jgi:hypothetical protein
MDDQQPNLSVERESVEWDLAVAGLDELALAEDGKPRADWKAAVAAWHIQRLAAARAEAWIPGTAEQRDPVVDAALARFHSHHVRLVVERLAAENAKLKAKLTQALQCVRFYAGGDTDAGRRARAAMSQLGRHGGTERAAATPGNGDSRTIEPAVPSRGELDEGWPVNGASGGRNEVRA